MLEPSPAYSEQEIDYFEKVMNAVLVAITTADSNTPKAGIIDMPIAFDAVAAAIAILAVKSTNYPNPRDMRLLGEDIGKKVAMFMRRNAIAEAAGHGINWHISPMKTRDS